MKEIMTYNFTMNNNINIVSKNNLYTYTLKCIFGKTMTSLVQSNQEKHFLYDIMEQNQI